MNRRGEGVSGNAFSGGPKSAKARVQHHRAKLQRHRRRRIEVSIGIPIINAMRQIASAGNKPLWSAVQDALEGYVEEFHRLIVEHQRLNKERARLLGQEDSPAHRCQIEEYNRRLAAFNERLCRFRKPTGDLETMGNTVDHDLVTGN
ncbi:MAG: hypothetical protein M3Z35_01970 [Nitrospirota bacterium]|nr:hypothetical protein [Nitrospirota bacterium]